MRIADFYAGVVEISLARLENGWINAIVVLLIVRYAGCTDTQLKWFAFRYEKTNTFAIRSIRTLDISWTLLYRAMARLSLSLSLSLLAVWIILITSRTEIRKRPWPEIWLLLNFLDGFHYTVNRETTRVKLRWKIWEKQLFSLHFLTGYPIQGSPLSLLEAH